jgi:signal transduction histidine kinase
MPPSRLGKLVRSARDRSGTVRVRTTAVATLVVGTVLVVAAIALVILLRNSLTEDLRAQARLRARGVGVQLSEGTLPAPIPATGDGEDEYIQVLDSSGDVVASTQNVSGGPPLVRLSPGESTQLPVPFDEDPFLAVARSVETPQGGTVVVGRALDNVRESSGTLSRLLMIGVPLLLIVVAAVTWRVVGKALAPVERIRAEVDAISVEELHRRVPIPATGDEIARLGETMNEMLGRLEAGQARQRRFVSDASHELRSPVASIRQHAEVTLAHPTSTSTEDLAELVLAEGLRLQRLVEDLLLLARMDETSSDGFKAVVDFDDIVFEEVDRIRQVSSKTIDTSRVSAGRVFGDSKRLARLVGNVLDNAARHSRDTISVSLFEEGDEVVFRVDDDGLGIPPAERQRIFERFVRLEDARDRDSGGSGLGLAIVSEVAAYHAGLARVMESPLGGARLEIRVPRTSH